MKTEIKQYYKNLEHINSLKEIISLKRKRFEETISSGLSEIESCEVFNAELKKQISDESIIKFKETGEKKLEFGLGIRVSTKIHYYEDAAIRWAKENMPIAVKQVIDKKQFETFAKGNELDFVDKIENVTVTFPKELKRTNE